MQVGDFIFGKNIDFHILKSIMRDKKATTQHKPTYISLFSSAWVGCHWFQTEWFECIATVELLEKRLNIQKYNKKCLYDTWYIAWDLCDESVQSKVRWNIEHYHKTLKRELDVLIATPPCQWMSVANHKKWNETKRNSLIVESIRLTKEFSPKIFIFENVSAFLHTRCTDIDNTEKKIEDVIDINLWWTYNILSKVINFKNYGSNSSRTRTLVIGIRKDQKNITPFDFFPTKQSEKTLYEVIGDLPSLREIWEINEFDIYHQFKKYNPEMRSWIQDIKEGESAFDNIDISKVPHKKENGIIVINQNKNWDKYKRQFYNKVAPCIHTRNDILASQNTIHPKDDRVFSIRELMRMMTIPSDFKWTEDKLSELNQLSISEKIAFLKKWEMTIRHSIWEAVPTIIFEQIAKKISSYLHRRILSQTDILRYIEEYNLTKVSNLLEFLQKNTLELDYTSLLNIAEYSNTKRDESAAYYTSQDIVYSLVRNLPEAKNYKEIRILEPSVWIGSFIPTIIKKYEDVARVIIDVVDINDDSLKLLRVLLSKIHIPNNIIINYHHDDFLKFESEKQYDIIIGNPPFWKWMIEKKHSLELREYMQNKSTGNVFALSLIHI